MRRRWNRRVVRAVTVVVAAGLLAAACTSGDDATEAPPVTDTVAPATTVATLDTTSDTVASPDPNAQYTATIRRTSYGIPHIEAPDYPSVMFGQGWAFAEDRACTLLDQVIKVRSERSKWFGPGDDGEHLTSDFAYLHLGVIAGAKGNWTYGAVSDELKTALTAWSDGFNASVDELGNDALPGWCRGEAWADTDVSPIDLLAYFNDLQLLASGRVFLDSIGSAQPPAAATTAAEPTPDTIAAALDTSTTAASNGWAIGSERSTTGGGLLLANPHFPWEGELRLWESHLTVPGELDLYGVSLSGVPGVLIGFTDAFAWTHTVSAGSRFTAYRLPLVEGDPTTYRYDGEPTALVSTDYEIEVLGDDGSLGTERRTLWSSRYGPIAEVGPLTWDASFAYTIRDANLLNTKALDQFVAMDRAGSLEEFQEVHAKYNGIPWVNTIAVSADGRAWYADTASTPRLSPEGLAAYEALKQSDPVVATVAQNGAFLLDGSDPVFAWTDAPDAREPGLVPFSEQPKIERTDYVFNANNSYWLANPSTPLTGFSPLHGGEETPPGGRPRMNALLIEESAGPDGLFDLGEVRDALFSNRSLTGEQWRDEIVGRCRASGRSELAVACEVLGDWDLTYGVDSVGSVVWNGMLREIAAVKGNRFIADSDVWATRFDPTDPIVTPNGLAPDEATTTLVLDAIAVTVEAMASVGIAVDAPLGEVQRDARVGGSIAVPGSSTDDVANINSCCANGGKTLAPKGEYGSFVGNQDFTDRGIVPVTYGATFVMALQFGPDGPVAEAVLTYGQPDDPADPEFTRQTELLADSGLRPVLFRSADISADPELQQYTVSR